jgi:antitoxin component YwqK of YwqJK toxin-antitoxin module
MKLLPSLILFLSANFTLFAQGQPRLITEDKPYYTVTFYQVNGEKDGQYKETYKQNGNVKTEGVYKTGRKEGVWKYFDIQGIIEKEETYKTDRLNGPVTTYTLGKISVIENFLNGEKDGLSLKFLNDTTLIEKCTYRRGVLLSRYSYFPDGKIKSEEVIPQDKNKTYFYKQYYNSGAKRVVSTMKDGDCIKSKSYHENGQVETISETVDGQLKVVRKFSATGVEVNPGCGC